MLVVEKREMPTLCDKEGDPANSKSALPPLSSEETAWPSGLTPPFRNVRSKRFRKRLEKRQVEDIEVEVQRLLELDFLAEDVSTC